MNYFIADMNIGYENVLAYDNRPFSTILEHDKEIMRRWNERVTEEDDVYIIGNLSWLSVKNTVNFLNNLNGRKHLIKGSHDHVLLREKEVKECFVEVRDYKELAIEGGTGVVLCSYPMLFFNNMHKGWFHFYGGLHDTYQDNVLNRVKGQIADLQHFPVRMINVGVMKPWMDFTPRTFDELRREFYKNRKRRKSA